ncbi:MAG: hypothetical protein NVSMB57_01020 [Actinomycetota bacterium]
MILSAVDISVRYEGLCAVDGASLQCEPGAITGLIGPNGAGKTTLFNAIGGWVRPLNGRIIYKGRDITSLSPARRAALGIARTFQRLELFGGMTVQDNFMVAAEGRSSRVPIAADLLGLPARKRDVQRCAEVVDGTLEMLGLGWTKDRVAAELPVGTARLVELGRALCTEPSMLLLDEPSSGLASQEAQTLGETLRRLAREQGLAVLLVEHDIDLVLKICDVVNVIEFGRIIATGTPARISADPAVRSAYLGKEDSAAAGSQP